MVEHSSDKITVIQTTKPIESCNSQSVSRIPLIQRLNSMIKENTLLVDSGQEGKCLDIPSCDNSSEGQRSRILNHLRTGQPLTTIFSRDVLGICHPAARVMELRKQGHNIKTHHVDEIDSVGVPHRVAKYIYTPPEVQIT